MPGYGGDHRRGVGAFAAPTRPLSCAQTGRTDADLTGRDLAGYFRRDEEGRIFAREAPGMLPIAIFRVLLCSDQPDGPALILLVDQPGNVAAGARRSPISRRCSRCSLRSGNDRPGRTVALHQ